MRITGGVHGSRRIRGPSRSMPVRPTPDSLRERAYSIIGDRVLDADVLDLFAGTGVVGLEALSRGAAHAVFIEVHRSAARLIAENRDSLGFDDQVARIVIAQAHRALPRLARSGRVFDLVWADPPFDRWEIGLQALTEVVRLDMVSRSALLCLECPSEAVLDEADASLCMTRDIPSGASRLVFFTPRSES